jgi:uncharacterized protein YbjT (DUF2867 family)
MSLLIIGGTGTLGRQIVKTALDEGYQVKCLVRNFRRASFLKNWGAELVYGDLSLPATIPTTLKGVNTIIDAATIRATDNYTAEKIDWRGKIALLEAAKLVNITRFISFSFLGDTENSSIPLLDLKLKFEQQLKNSNLKYTIFYCGGFFQGLIDQYAVPILEKQNIWVFRNSVKTAYIDTQDVAKIVVETLSINSNDSFKYNLSGLKLWNPEEIIQLCERLSGEKAKISYLPGPFFAVLQKVFRGLEFTWNIADRLKFSDIKPPQESDINKLETYSNQNLLSLEQYLQEYFSKILKKLKEANYQQQNDGISFL